MYKRTSVLLETSSLAIIMPRLLNPGERRHSYEVVMRSNLARLSAEHPFGRATLFSLPVCMQCYAAIGRLPHVSTDFAASAIKDSVTSHNTYAQEQQHVGTKQRL